VFGDQYKDIIEGLDDIDPYFTTLNELRQEIKSVFHHSLQEVHNG